MNQLEKISIVGRVSRKYSISDELQNHKLNILETLVSFNFWQIWRWHIKVPHSSRGRKYSSGEEGLKTTDLVKCCIIKYYIYMYKLIGVHVKSIKTFLLI